MTFYMYGVDVCFQKMSEVVEFVQLWLNTKINSCNSRRPSNGYTFYYNEEEYYFNFDYSYKYMYVAIGNRYVDCDIFCIDDTHFHKEIDEYFRKKFPEIYTPILH